MEGLKERFLKFRYNGMLVIMLVFLIIAVILFVERSGISYNYDKADMGFLPKENIITKQKSNLHLKKNTVVLWASEQPDSKDVLEEFKTMFSDMKIGYKAVDLSKKPFPDLSDYDIAVVLISDLSPMGEDVITMNRWVKSGGNVQFAVTLQKNIYTSVIEQSLGIEDSSWYNALVDSVYIDDGFMVGGGCSFNIEDGYHSAWAVQLNPKKVKLHAWVDNENKTPLIWEVKYGKGKYVVDNIGLNEKGMRGFYAASYSLLDEICVYPVINSSTFFLDDFPSQVPDGNSEYILRDYKSSIRDFYVNIWWPDMMNFADKYGIKYTGLAIVCYDDNVDGTTPSKADKGTFLNFGNMLLRHGGEIGYHGYNHQPLCMDECDYDGVYDYKTWQSTKAMEKAFDSLIDLCDELFEGVNISLYVPPSNIMTSVGEDFLKQTYPHINCISGIYFTDGEFEHNFVQEFEVLPDGRVYQPRIVSGCNLTDFMKLALVSELNLHFTNSHFTHPDDALDPDRGAELGWEKLSDEFNEYLDYLYTAAPDIRNLTGSETTAAIQRYCALNVKKKLKGDTLKLDIGNFYDEGYFFIRFNEREYKSIDGGSLTRLTGDLYLLRADKSEVTIKLK